MSGKKLLFFCLSLCVLLAVQACGQYRSADLSLLDVSGVELGLLAADSASRAGRLQRDEGTLRYRLNAPVEAEALELYYELPAEPQAVVGLVVFRAEGQNAWALPGPSEIPEAVQADGVFRLRYRLPLTLNPLSAFTIGVEQNDAKADQKNSRLSALAETASQVPRFTLKLLSFRERAFGRDDTASPLWVTPFIYREKLDARRRVVIDIPDEFRADIGFDLRFRGDSGEISLSAGEKRFICPDSSAGASSGMNAGLFVLNAGLFDKAPNPLLYEADNWPRLFMVVPTRQQSFPEPIALDPGLILSYRWEAWRDPRFEVFRWPSFPSVLIFDTADYATQDRLFKRLAFFVEKAGYIGKLMKYKDIAHLHGWNAHDYKAEDLAAFFSAVMASGFSVSKEEEELKRILCDQGIIQEKENSYVAGKGAIISLSRESASYLRAMFMTHESYHALFFTDEEFRLFAAGRWERLDEKAKRFLIAYFDQNRYDTANAELMVNEFMAYCLQQSVSSALKYFGETLPSRLANDPRRASALGPKDLSTGTWPDLAELFRAEVAAFHEYVKKRWGLRAGSVNAVYQASSDTARR